jgi:hypothetical protein
MGITTANHQCTHIKGGAHDPNTLHHTSATYYRWKGWGLCTSWPKKLRNDSRKKQKTQSNRIKIKIKHKERLVRAHSGHMEMETTSMKKKQNAV